MAVEMISLENSLGVKKKLLSSNLKVETMNNSTRYFKQNKGKNCLCIRFKTRCELA